MVHSDSIKLLSVNCQGLRGKQKRMEVLTYLKETKASIVCLEDTHLIEDDLNSVKQIWGNCHLHGIKTNSRGIGILLNKDFEFDVLEIKKDKEGNMLSLLISIDTMKINLITIYGPNNDDPNFFKDLQNNIDCTNAQYTIVCGDFNLVLDPKKDCIHYTNVNNPRARTEVLEMIKNKNLVDVYREINPDGKKFSWRRRNPTKMARLDYFLVTHSMMDIIDACDIKPSYKSDHSIIELKIKLSHFRYGKGFWKFNNSLLKQQDCLDLINNVIQAEKFKYALPVYNLDYLKHTNNNIQFTIDNDTFLEVLFLQIRGETIKYSSKLKREQSQ